MTSSSQATKLTVFVATLSLIALTSPDMSLAQTTDITSSGLNTAIHASGTTTFIDGGTRPGADFNQPNLFHSFGDFSVATGHTAMFRNLDASGAAGTGYGDTTENIFGRVTGGNVSNLFGTVDSATNFPQANLWLINPAGVVFGPNAHLNVGGSINVSTADYLKMTDGATFFADLSQATVLSIAPVAAFGFLGTNPGGTVTIQGGTVNNASTLTLVGRDIMDSSGNTTKPGITVTGGTLSNPGGGINLVSVKTPQDTAAGGEILAGDLSPASGNGFSALGTVQMDSGGTLNTTSMAHRMAGSIFIHAGNFVMDHAGIDSRTRTFSDSTGFGMVGGDVDIRSSTVTLTGGVSPAKLFGDSRDVEMATIITNATADITISALNVKLDNAVLRTDTPTNAFGIGSDSFNDIRIQGVNGADSLAAQVMIVKNSRMEALGLFEDIAAVPGGNVTVHADQITLGNSVINNVQGAGIDLYGDHGVFSLGNNTIQTSSQEGGSGPITIRSGSKVELSMADAIVSRTNLIDTQSGVGSPGDITISAPLIDIRGTSIASSGSALVRVGDINLFGESIRVQGARLATSTVSIQQDLSFLVEIFGLSEAGTIRIGGFETGTKAQTIEIISSQLQSELQHVLQDGVVIGAIGNSGSIVLNGHAITLDGADLSVQHPGAGKSGSITVTGGQVRMLNGSVLTSSTSGLDTVIFSVREPFDKPLAAAPGGNIAVTATGTIDLSTGSSIRATSSGDGNAGDITLTAGHDIQVRQSTVTTSTSGEKTSGGNIKLTAPNLIRIVDSIITSSVQGQAGSDGGNIDIDPQLVVIQNSQILANANAGAGGNISIAATGAVLIDPNSRIDSSAGPAGVSGSVNINSPIQVLSGALVPLNLVYSQAGLSGDRCAADPQGQFSSFVQSGRDGVPQVPGALSPSPISFLDPLALGSWGSPMPNWATARLGLDSLRVDGSTLFRFHSACRS